MERIFRSPLKPDHFQMGRSSDGITEEPRVKVNKGIPKDIYSSHHHYTTLKTFGGKCEDDFSWKVLIKIDDREISVITMNLNTTIKSKEKPFQGYYVRFAVSGVRFILKSNLTEGLKESNCDHCNAYIKQHEVHLMRTKLDGKIRQPNNDSFGTK
ncbi:hypothetical protein Tco_1108411 [Tanacetum coccineum]